MGRAADAIQAEITKLETWLASSTSLDSSYSADGVSINRMDVSKATKRLDQLYLQLDRANGTTPMFTRGVTRGGMFS